MSSNQMKLLLAAATAAVPFILHGCKGDEATTSNVAEGCLEIQCAGKSFECSRENKVQPISNFITLIFEQRNEMILDDSLRIRFRCIA
jgi:hypothetical protein